MSKRRQKDDKNKTIMFFVDDPEVANIMASYEQQGWGSTQCVQKLPWQANPETLCTPHQHPDAGYAWEEIPRDTTDPRYAHWGAFVHPQVVNYGSNIGPSLDCTAPMGFGSGM
jgi:hypothetical protein